MVHMLAESDGMPLGFKLTSRHNIMLNDLGWIAGVTMRWTKNTETKQKTNSAYSVEDEDDYEYEKNGF